MDFANQKIQSWNGLLIPTCHLMTESVQGPAGFPTCSSLSNFYIKIVNAWGHIISYLDNWINKRKSTVLFMVIFVSSTRMLLLHSSTTFFLTKVFMSLDRLIRL